SPASISGNTSSMEQPTYQATALPTTTATTPTVIDGRTWQNPSRITVRDDSSASLRDTSGADNGATISAARFQFRSLHDTPVIDGRAVTIKGANQDNQGWGYVTLNIPGSTTTGQPILTLNKTYGAYGYFWGLDSLAPSDLTGLEVTVSSDDLSG